VRHRRRAAGSAKSRAGARPTTATFKIAPINDSDHGRRPPSLFGPIPAIEALSKRISPGAHIGVEVFRAGLQERFGTKSGAQTGARTDQRPSELGPV